VISVRGTTFDVSVNDDDETTTVEVEEGLVEVQHALLPAGIRRCSRPAETLRVYKNEPLASSMIDKGTIARQVLRSVMDAVTTVALRIPRTGGSIGGSGGIAGTGINTSVGDTGKRPLRPPRLLRRRQRRLPRFRRFTRLADRFAFLIQHLRPKSGGSTKGR